MSDSIREAIFRWLMAQNVTAYWVGGSVRDWVLQRHVHDLDIVVDGHSIRLGRRLADELGGAFYVLDAKREAARVLLPTGAKQPFSVDLTRMCGGDIHSDLAARDFTINAMALPIGATSLHDLIDPFGGLTDLKQGHLRAVSSVSLYNDPLRTFRAVRMVHQFGLRTEPATESFICQAASLLPQVSAERIRDEMCRILDLSPVGPPVADLCRLGLLRAVFERFGREHSVPLGRILGDLACSLPESPPAMDTPLHRALEVLAAWDLLFASEEQPSLVVKHTPAVEMFRGVIQRHRDLLLPRLQTTIVGHRTSSLMLKWVMLLFYTGGIAYVSTVLNGLRFSNAEIRRSVTLANVFTQPGTWIEQQDISRRDLYRFYKQARDCGPEAIALFLTDRLAALVRGETTESPAQVAAVADKAWRAYFESYNEIVAPPRLVDGEIIMARLGIPQGPLVRELLEQIQEAQVTGEIRSREEALSWLDERARRRT